MPSSIRGVLLRVFVVALAALLLLGTAAPPASASLSNREKKLFIKINKARQNHGKKPLDLSLKISKKARNHSENMAQKGYIYHSCLTCKFKGWNWHALGENVATGPGVKAVHKKFMRSPGHRANILGSQYDKVGVGIVWAKGKLWVTEIFYG
jgi:uncharacterized protein YkwD